MRTFLVVATAVAAVAETENQKSRPKVKWPPPLACHLDVNCSSVGGRGGRFVVKLAASTRKQ